MRLCKKILSFLFVFCTRFILGLSLGFNSGDECLLLNNNDGTGICKSAFDCQWIRDEKIHEKNWTHCNLDESSYLICCADPAFTIQEKLDCHTDTKDIFSCKTMNACLAREKNSVSLNQATSNLPFDKIYYTDDQCKLLHDEHKRLELLEGSVEGVAHGVNADPGEFPFFAVILGKQQDGTYTRQCGGLILTRRHVLTAAHCIRHNLTEYVETTRVRVGSIYFDQIYQEIQVAKSPVSYPAFKNSGSGYDIAIIYLAEDIKISKNAIPACLYHGNQELVPESRATVIGFGKTNVTDNPNILQKAQINIKDPLYCSPGIISKHNFEGIKNEQICAGDSNVVSDTCEGDSGGPLIQVLINEWKTVVGLTSFGPSFCNSNYIPGVYTRVSSFIPWIDNEIKKDFV